MAIDKVKPLKIEHSTNGGTEIDPFPTETDPSEDYISAKGIALEGNEIAVVSAAAGLMSLKDSEVTTAVSLQDLAYRLKQKNVDLTNLNTGNLLTWNTGTNSFELQPLGQITPNITPRCAFTKVGNLTVGTYLRIGEVISSTSGLTLRGSNKIVGIYVTAGTAATATSRIQLQRRTSVNTFVDITDAYVDVLLNEYKGKNDPISITLLANEELSCYLKSGATMTNVVVSVFLSGA